MSFLAIARSIFQCWIHLGINRSLEVHGPIVAYIGSSDLTIIIQVNFRIPIPFTSGKCNLLYRQLLQSFIAYHLWIVCGWHSLCSKPIGRFQTQIQRESLLVISPSKQLARSTTFNLVRQISGSLRTYGFSDYSLFLAAHPGRSVVSWHGYTRWMSS